MSNRFPADDEHLHPYPGNLKHYKVEPLLSDADVSKMSVTENGFAGENKHRMGRRIRDYYESLITTGKLRVVEECGYVPPDTWCSVCICKGCGEACSEVGEKDPYPHCPYCTRKIKR